MKKLYYGLLVLGVLAGIQSTSYGAAAPARRKITMISSQNTYGWKQGMKIQELYTKEDDTWCTTCIIEYKTNNQGNKNYNAFSCSKYPAPCVPLQERDYKKILELDQQDALPLSFEIIRQYQEQENKNAAEQVPGGYMVPNPAGGWMPKPESKDDKSDQ